jgi:hypothetical protein
MNEAVAKDLAQLVNSMNDFIKSKSVKYGATTFDYVPLDDILDRCKYHKKWAVQQHLSHENGMPTIETVFTHESGEEVRSGKFPLVFSANAKPQEIGSIITYMKRYQLGAFLGLATETDNDANFESEVKENKLTPKQAEIIERAYTGENMAKLLQANNITRLSDLPMKKASELISKIMEKAKV